MFRIRLKQHFKEFNYYIYHMIDLLLYLENTYEQIQVKVDKFIDHIEKFYM